MMTLFLPETPSQTAGPYVHIGCTPNRVGMADMYGGEDLGSSLINAHTQGRRITISGRIIDGTGAPIRDGLVEIWQADANGYYNSPHETRGIPDPDFVGFGRQSTDLEDCIFHFETIVPGPVPWRDGRLQAPHINVWIAGRGINLGLHTRMYFPDFEQENRSDPVLGMLEHPSRIPTLIATLDQPDAYRFDITLQGPNETVFFEL